MSKVFTPEAVRYRHVPNVDAFTPLAMAYRTWLPHQHWFVGGIFLGSVLQGTQNRRSDIDLFVVVKEGRGPIAAQALADFKRLRAGSIPVNSELWSEHELRNGIHTVGHGFLAHLKWASEHGGPIGGSPILSITLRKRHGPQEDLEGYVAKKVKKLREFSCERRRWTEQRCKALADVGMASIHATRRWLSLQGYADNELRGKEDVVALLRERRPDLGEKLSNLLAADATYEQVLNACLVNYDHRMYLDALDELSRHVGDATVFLLSLTNK